MNQFWGLIILFLCWWCVCGYIEDDTIMGLWLALWTTCVFIGVITGFLLLKG